MVLADRQEVVHCDDVVDSVSEYSVLFLPRVPEHFHIFLSDLASRSGGQDSSGIDDLMEKDVR